MPMTKTGKKVMEKMRKTYGSKEKAEQVFYAMENKKKTWAKAKNKKGGK